MSAGVNGRKAGCYFCGGENAIHYLGGGMWVCYRGWLAALGFGRSCK